MSQVNTTKQQAEERVEAWRRDPTGDPDVIEPIIDSLLAAHAEIERMRPVHERALAWHRCADGEPNKNGCGRHNRRLFDAIEESLRSNRGGDGE